MDRVIRTIGVAVCPCTELFHGQLTGQKMLVSSPEDEEPEEFELQEIEIPEDDTHRAQYLREKGGQVFVDVHGCTAIVWLNEVRPGERYPFSFGKSKLISWTPPDEQPPTADELVGVIRDLIVELGEKEREEEWLAPWDEMARQLASAAT